MENGIEPLYVNGDAVAGSALAALDDWAKDEEVHDDIDPEEGGWDLDADGGKFSAAHDIVDDADAVPEEEELGAGSTPGVSEVEHWVRNSPLPSEHIAAGLFDTVMQVSHAKLHVLREC